MLPENRKREEESDSWTIKENSILTSEKVVVRTAEPTSYMRLVGLG